MYTPREFIDRVVLRNLDALGVKTPERILQAFSSISTEADAQAQAAFEAFTQGAGEGDPGDYFEEARDEGIDYYVTFRGVEQGLLNLLLVGLFHLHEQHFAEFKRLVRAEGKKLPRVEQLGAYSKIVELEYVANAIKHGEGTAVEDVRRGRPDLLVDPLFRGTTMEKRIREGAPKALSASLVGGGLWITPSDLADFQSQLRLFWEQIRAAL